MAGVTMTDYTETRYTLYDVEYADGTVKRGEPGDGFGPYQGEKAGAIRWRRAASWMAAS
jgi:hypothetical protein